MDYQLTKQELRKNKINRHLFLNLKRFPIICVLNNPESLFNIGVIIRTCEAFRIEKLIISSQKEINLNSKKIKKTSKKAHKWFNVQIEKDIFKVIKNLKENNYSIVAVEITKNSFVYKEITFNYPIAFIFGNEKKGLENEAINICDYSIHIDMYGMGNSLNLAVCSGIII